MFRKRSFLHEAVEGCGRKLRETEQEDDEAEQHRTEQVGQEGNLRTHRLQAGGHRRRQQDQHVLRRLLQQLRRHAAPEPHQDAVRLRAERQRLVQPRQLPAAQHHLHHHVREPHQQLQDRGPGLPQQDHRRHQDQRVGRLRVLGGAAAQPDRAVHQVLQGLRQRQGHLQAAEQVSEGLQCVQKVRRRRDPGHHGVCPGLDQADGQGHDPGRQQREPVRRQGEDEQLVQLQQHLGQEGAGHRHQLRGDPHQGCSL